MPPKRTTVKGQDATPPVGGVAEAGPSGADREHSHTPELDDDDDGNPEPEVHRQADPAARDPMVGPPVDHRTSQASCPGPQFDIEELEDRPPDSLSSAELDFLLEYHEMRREREQKEKRLLALRQGKDPDTSERAPRGDSRKSWYKVPQKLPEWDGQSYDQFQTFVEELEERFMLDDIEPTEPEKIHLASTLLPKTMKSRWRAHHRRVYGKTGGAVWEDLKLFLTEQLVDDETREMSVTEKLFSDQTLQKPNQSYAKFIDRLDSLFNEVSLPFPDKWRMWLILTKLNKPLRDQIVAAGIPTDSKSLGIAARQAEITLSRKNEEEAPRNDRPRHNRGEKRGRNGAPNRARTATVRPSIPPQGFVESIEVDDTDTQGHPKRRNKSSVTCYGCNEKGHYRNECPKEISNLGQSSGYSAGQNPNNLPVNPRAPVVGQAQA